MILLECLPLRRPSCAYCRQLHVGMHDGRLMGEPTHRLSISVFTSKPWLWRRCRGMTRAASAVGEEQLTHCLSFIAHCYPADKNRRCDLSITFSHHPGTGVCGSITPAAPLDRFLRVFPSTHRDRSLPKGMSHRGLFFLRRRMLGQWVPF